MPMAAEWPMDRKEWTVAEILAMSEEERQRIYAERGPVTDVSTLPPGYLNDVCDRARRKLNLDINGNPLPLCR
jgi:hypothetical protein